MPPMNFVVEHIGLPSLEPTTLKEWYVRVLDGEVVWHDPAVPLYFVRLGGSLVLEIGPSKRVVPDVGDNSVAGIRHFALQVESIETAKQELETRGVVFTEPVKPAGGGGSVLFFKDAEGNLLHFVERPAGSVFKKN